MLHIPELAPDEYGPPDPSRGLLTLSAWLLAERHGLKMRKFTTGAEISAAISAYPGLADWIRENPGPYAQQLAELDADTCRIAIDELLNTERTQIKSPG